MLKDLVPVHRALVTIDLLPDKVKWASVENVMGIESGRVFVARVKSTDQPVVGTARGSKLVYTNINRMPDCDQIIDPGLQEWKVSQPEWCPKAAPIDMHTSVDLSFLDTQYLDTIFGKFTVVLFAKNALVRARPTAGLEKKLMEMIRTPDDVSTSYELKKFPTQVHNDLYYTCMEPLPEELYRAKEAELKQTETQLQVLLLLELFSRDPSVETLLDAHFDRLLLWQALSDSRSDAVVALCNEVVWPFFRDQSREKATQLIRRSRGESEERGTRERSSAKHSLTKNIATKSASLLARAHTMSLRTETSLKNHSSKSGAKPAVETPTIAMSDSLRHTFRREVEISFKPKKLARTKTQPLPQQTSSAPKRIRPSPTVHVYDTPVSKRTVMLAKEDIELPNLEIESTDEDE